MKPYFDLRPLLTDTLLGEVVTRLRAAQRVVLITHVYPDGDALGSSLALARALDQLGIEAVCLDRDEAPHAFRFLPEIDRFIHEPAVRASDTIVTLDCGDLGRTGFPDLLQTVAASGGTLINIDHHQRNDLHKLATLNAVNSDASSACEITAEIIAALGIRFDKQIATNLLAGIYFDTGGFRHSNTTHRVLELASRLMAAGGRLREITRHVSTFRSVTALRLWGVALERVRYHRTLGIVASVITQIDLARCGALHEDIAGAVNLINHVPEARVAMICSELVDGSIKASLRTEANDVDVSALANLFGGGGLKKAAGFSIRGSIQVNDTGDWQIVPDAPAVEFPQLLPLDRLGAITAPAYTLTA